MQIIKIAIFSLKFYHASNKELVSKSNEASDIT